MNPFSPETKSGPILIGIFYILCGSIHFIMPSFYLKYMPVWIEPQLFWVYFSGWVEIFLGILIFVPKTRKWSAMAIVVMLFVYLFLIHIPVTMGFLKTDPRAFSISMARNPIQLLLIYWAYLYTK